MVKIVRVGDKRLGGKASEFRYLLRQTKNGADKAHPIADSWVEQKERAPKKVSSW